MASYIDPYLIILTAPVLITVIALIFFRTKTPRKIASSNLPPGSFGWPILGETLDFIRTIEQGSPAKFLTDRMIKYNSPVFKTSLMGEPMAVLCGPAGNKFMFGNENKTVTVWWLGPVRKLLGTCLATTGGVEGVHMRKMLAWFLSPEACSKIYIETMELVSRQHLDVHWRGKEELKVLPWVKMFTFELACRLFLSMEPPEQIARLASLFNVMLSGILSVPLNFLGTKFHRTKRATACIKKELTIIVRQRREALEQKTASPSQDILSHLLVMPDEKGEFMSESVIVNNIVMLLFAGNDTTTCAITAMIEALAKHPRIYERVLREQNEVASLKKPGEFLQWEDILKMKYSWNVVCETMRLWPPAIGAFREALVDINYRGYVIPKGWKMYWNAQATHMDSSLFPDEKTFDPSRFDGSGPIPYSFVPFGGGPRMCLGKEFARFAILTFMHHVVRRFSWNIVMPCDSIKELSIRIHSHNGCNQYIARGCN